MNILLASLGSSVQVIAESDGLWLRVSSGGVGVLVEPSRWPADAAAAEAGRITALEMEQLLEQGLADVVGDDIKIPYAHFGTIRTLGLQVTSRWTEWSPFMLSIAPVGDLGRADFAYRYRFFFGAMEVKLERMGYFVRRVAKSAVFHLDDQTFALVEAIDRFNDLAAQDKTSRENWVTFSIVKGCAREVGAALDVLLQSNEVVIPSRIALKIQQHADASISFVPRCGGVPDEEMEKAFLALPTVEGVYSVDLPTGGRLRVVLDDEQQEVLRRMKQVQRLRGEAKREAIRSPEKFFDGVLGRIDLPYGRRVVGIGEFPFVAVSTQKVTRSGIFDGIERDVPAPVTAAEEESASAQGDSPSQICCRKSDDNSDVHIDFPDAASRRQFQERVRDALGQGKDSVEYDDTRIRIDDELAEILLRPPVGKPTGHNQTKPSGRYLLIYTDEEDLKPWDEEAVQGAVSTIAPAVEFSRPESLCADVKLKVHQESGVQWLQACAQLRTEGRRGVLLADDMGLGKTLQVLTYLAWAIEQGRLSPPGADPDTAPWRPILIIAPLILVEDGTWEREIQQFFKNSGSIFDPIRVLHGLALDEFRAESPRRRETQLGSPTLDPAKLMQYRLVITNYETVKNYQHSFAQTVDGKPIWSIVITDEAQEFKTPNTKISHAVKALEPDFHIACTGTPVENRLLDIWNIFDSLQPALLGTAKEFTATYEAPPADPQPETRLTHLKERLLFGKPNAFLVRREKCQVLDLPAKREVRLVSDMSPDEVEIHVSLVGQLRHHQQSAATHLGILHRLAQLYQHPALVNDSWSRKGSADLTGESSKLRSVLQELHKIKHQREKAIIFARLVTVQQLLAYVLSEEFDLDVKIINGATARGSFERSSATTKRAKETRSRLLSDFKTKPGFNILILSPFVAGVGLNITEANHVFHYGRWWNPAVESQATDRAYRIGQEKEVKVYFPTLRDPSRRLTSSFDECLDQLLQKKSVLARDFLRPLDSDDSNVQDLCDSLLRDQPEPVAAAIRRLDYADISRLSPSDFEALTACMYEAKGLQTVLTCQSNDAGADVVAVGAREAWLIQAKHSAAHAPVGPEAVDDLLAAQTVYQNAAFRPFKLAVVSNVKFSHECARRAAQCGVSLVDGVELSRRLEEFPVTLGQVVARSVARAGTFSEGVELIRRIRG